jgi:Fic family protein
VTDIPVERSDIAEEPYEPFPSFESFAASGFDLVTVTEFVGVLEAAKNASEPEKLRHAVDRATRWAAVDTGAIEGLYDVDRGFTFSVAAEAAAWDNMHLNVGDDAKRSIEDALAAYEFVLDIVTESRPITETWIKELHAVICASQGTYAVLTAAGKQEHDLPKGAYKKHKNNPFNVRAQKLHSYASVDDTPAEMHRLVEELNSAAFAAADPVVQAAYAHYAFVCIHPFADGNGRVSRALASIYLYRSPGVPLVIFADQKPGYIDALEAADDGDYRPFVQFVAASAVDVIRMVAAEMRRQPRPPAEERQAQLQTALLGRGGLPHEEIDALSGRIFDEWVTALQKAVDGNPLTKPLVVNIQVHGGMNPGTRSPEGYRFPPNPRTVQLIGASSGTATASVKHHYGVAIARGQSRLADFVIVNENVESMEDALIRDITPSTSPSLRYRLEIAAEEQFLALVDALADAAEAALKASGYTD